MQAADHGVQAGHIWQQQQGRTRRHADGLEPPGLNMRQRRCHVVEHQIGRAFEQRRQRGPRPGKRQMLQRHARQRLELLARNMADAAHTTRCIAQRLSVLGHEAQQIGRRVDAPLQRQFAAHDQHMRNARHQQQRREVAQRVVRQLRV